MKKLSLLLLLILPLAAYSQPFEGHLYQDYNFGGQDWTIDYHWNLTTFDFDASTLHIAGDLSKTGAYSNYQTLMTIEWEKASGTFGQLAYLQNGTSTGSIDTGAVNLSTDTVAIWVFGYCNGTNPQTVDGIKICDLTWDSQSATWATVYNPEFLQGSSDPNSGDDSGLDPGTLSAIEEQNELIKIIGSIILGFGLYTAMMRTWPKR
jgi:hypothetical protein